jgi:hypothetical protein
LVNKIYTDTEKRFIGALLLDPELMNKAYGQIHQPEDWSKCISLYILILIFNFCSFLYLHPFKSSAYIYKCRKIERSAGVF